MKELQHKEQRVAVLIDVQNLYYSAKHLWNTKVNFKEIMKTAVANRRLVRAIAYAIKADVKDENVFHEALMKLGIEVKAKDLLVFHGGHKKGDWDIGIAMDAVRLVSKVDCLILISGDGDFKDLLTYLKQRGLRTEVVAFSKTASIQIKTEADLFTDLGKDLNKYLINYKPGQTGSIPPNSGFKKTPASEFNKAAGLAGPAPRPAPRPVSKPAPRPAGKPAPRPAGNPAHKPINKPGTKPTGNSSFKRAPPNPNFKRAQGSYSRPPPRRQEAPRFGREPEVKHEVDMADLFSDEAPKDKPAPKAPVKSVEAKKPVAKAPVTKKPEAKKVDAKAPKKPEAKKTVPKKPEVKKTEVKKVEKKPAKKTEAKKVPKKKESVLTKIKKALTKE